MSNSKIIVVIDPEKNPRGIPHFKPGHGLQPRQQNMSEYQAMYRRWPFQTPRTSIRPTINTIHKPVDKRITQTDSTYRNDYAAPNMYGKIKSKKMKPQIKSSPQYKYIQDEIKQEQINQRKTTYLADYCSKKLPMRKPRTGEHYKPPDIKFCAKSTYEASYKLYSPDVMKNCRPNMKTPKSVFPSNKDQQQSEISQKGDADNPDQSNSKCNNLETKPLEQEKKVLKVCDIISGEPMNMDTDPTMMSIYMDDYHAHPNAKMRSPFKPDQSRLGKLLPFDGNTIYGSDYKSHPVSKPEVHTWAKKGVYKAPVEGMALNSTYAMDFIDPKVIHTVAKTKPDDIKDDIILQSSDKFAFDAKTTYNTTFKEWKGVQPAKSYKIQNAYNPPKNGMKHESMHMSSYKGHENTPKAKIIRHASEHRELNKDGKMMFQTTYRESYKNFRPKSSPGRLHGSKIFLGVKTAWEDNSTPRTDLNTSCDSGIDMIECDNQED